MIKIVNKRGTGKTSELIKLSELYNVPIVYAGNVVKSVYINTLANKMGCNIPEPIHVSELSSYGGSHIIVDDAEYVLQYLLGFQIMAFSMTEDDKTD